MLVIDPPRPKRRRPAEALAVVLVCFAALAAVVLPPGDWRLLAVPLALVAGAAVERYRQGGRERPLRLVDTPQEWKRALGVVGWPYVLAALAAAVAGAAVLALPELRSERLGRGTGETAPGGRDRAVKLPEVRVLRRRPGSRVRVGGASFTAFVPGAERWAQAIRSRRAGKDAVWLVVGVEGRNVDRRHFNPNALSYRLRDARGNRFAPTIGGGTGPDSLARTGFLERGETAQARLGFRVPSSARRLTLVFEPVADGSVQVEIPLRP